MKSYITLKNIKQEYLSDQYNKNEVSFLNRNIQKIIEALISDLKSITDEEITIYESKIYFDDVYFRQSATAYFFRAKFTNDNEYLLSIECLVDFDKIGIKPKTEPRNENLKSFHQNLLSKSNAEEFAELKTLTLQSEPKTTINQ
ncbi:hypothetical protein HUK80_17880 [Flavobacterium sp. MAH-1]|uniref:Uncharacterized protein n=1 Tax=Flavobacterium agri TaxID=2743471 RepID=A0A7Y9C6Y2_9FLAO|nr:hypothetical protein [Flavobacterium agri]NUY82774.1 hypothetical protein [Flavobacterium agri]NYA72796.1 hypothetical protein [Flavobacterium agri]